MIPQLETWTEVITVIDDDSDMHGKYFEAATFQGHEHSFQQLLRDWEPTPGPGADLPVRCGGTQQAARSSAAVASPL